ncbi:MAG TPA: RDD family protein [Actinomycetes bacterium]|nr:RDD family protein [Actinomycetes bacterium]
MSVSPEPGSETPERPASASPAPPSHDDLLGPRISAALIDLALLLGLFLVLVLLVGEISTSDGSLMFSLSGVEGVLYVTLALIYYFALEAAIGQTVGKSLLGLRVVRSDGARPSVGSVAVRTLLRIVDWLPLLYLIGFITMLATGQRRLRLGDLAAGTGLGRAAPARHRAIAAVVMSVLLLGLAGFAAQQADGSAEEISTYQGNGVSFDYPAGWRQGSGETGASSGGADTLWSTAVGVADRDLVTIQVYPLNVPVTEQNLDAVKPELEQLVGQLAAQLDGSVRSGPDEVTMAGLPGVRFEVTGTVDGISFQSLLVFAFADATEYFINCQHTDENADEIGQGCEQIMRTFTLT